MISPLEFRQVIETRLHGGILIDCTRKDGLENELVAKHLIAQLKMSPIVVIDCEDFPSFTQIVSGKPNFPVQIYSSVNSKISLLKSDFTIPKTHEKALARGLIAWVRKQSIGLIITLTPLGSSEGKSDDNRESSAAFSTESSRLRIVQSRIDLIKNGYVDGFSAALLTEGSFVNMDVIALQLQAHGSSPKEIAEKSIQAIDVAIPEAKFDAGSLQLIETLDPRPSEGSTSIEK